MVAYDEPTVEGICGRLRRLIQEAFQKHLYTTAIFYADKLVSLSGSPEDVYTLAECYFKNREYRRVLHVLLKKYGDATSGDDRLKLLAAQSFIECREWEECLRYLEANSAGFIECREWEECLRYLEANGTVDARMESAFALLRGRVYEVLENQEKALHCYERAVRLDPYCHEALDRLVGNHLLTLDRELALLSDLNFHEEDEWLRHLYAAKLAGRRGERAEDYPVPQMPKALKKNGQTLAAQATRNFYEGDFESCYLLSKRVLEEDPFHLATMPVHVASLVVLEKRNVVFCAAQHLFKAYPQEAVAWFTAGCYYYMLRRYEHARRFLHKAKSLDQSFAPAWIAYGHAFAQHDESDQALAAYRTASRLFPGSHLPWLFIGVEYVRTNSLQLAQQFLESARVLMPRDPHVLNELGVVAFHRRHYDQACELLLQALQLCAHPHESFCSNLGHALLKCRAYDRALEAFQQAHRLNPRSASVLSGIAFSLQLLGRLEEAIENYHRALSLQRDDVFAAEMLTYAVQEAAEQPIGMDF